VKTAGVRSLLGFGVDESEKRREKVGEGCVGEGEGEGGEASE
jgi:hypothetical protein